MTVMSQLAWSEWSHWWQRWQSLGMVPSNLEEMGHEGAINVNRVSFDAKTVWAIVAAVVGIVVTMLYTSFGMRSEMAEVQSEMRVIIATMEGKREVDAVNAKLSDERMAGLRSEMADMRRRMELMQFEMQQLQKDTNLRGR